MELRFSLIHFSTLCYLICQKSLCLVESLLKLLKWWIEIDETKLGDIEWQLFEYLRLETTYDLPFSLYFLKFFFWIFSLSLSCYHSRSLSHFPICHPIAKFHLLMTPSFFFFFFIRKKKEWEKDEILFPSSK